MSNMFLKTTDDGWDERARGGMFRMWCGAGCLSYHYLSDLAFNAQRSAFNVTHGPMPVQHLTLKQTSVNPVKLTQPKMDYLRPVIHVMCNSTHLM